MIKWRTLAELTEKESLTQKEILENAIEAGESIFVLLPTEGTLLNSESTLFPYYTDGIFEITHHSAEMLTKRQSYLLSRVLIDYRDDGKKEEFRLTKSLEIGISDIRLKLPDSNEKANARLPATNNNPPSSPAPLPNSKSRSYPWVPEAKSIAEEILARSPKQSTLSNDDLARKVCKEMVKRGINGRGGKQLSAPTVKRHALSGIKK